MPRTGNVVEAGLLPPLLGPLFISICWSKTSTMCESEMTGNLTIGGIITRRETEGRQRSLRPEGSSVIGGCHNGIPV